MTTYAGTHSVSIVVSSGENSVPDHLELVYTAQNNFTLTFTLNYFFCPNRLLTSGARATKKLPEGNQHNLSISCIYKGSSHPSSECDPQITLKTRKPKTMSKYLKIVDLVQCPEMTEMVCLIVRSYYSSGIGVQLALSKLLENDQDLMINCLGILRKLQISLLA